MRVRRSRHPYSGPQTSRREFFQSNPAATQFTEKKLSTKAFIFPKMHPQLTKFLSPTFKLETPTSFIPGEGRDVNRRTSGPQKFTPLEAGDWRETCQKLSAQLRNSTMVGEGLSLPSGFPCAAALSSPGSVGSGLPVPAVHAWKDTLETIRCSSCGERLCLSFQVSEQGFWVGWE